MRIVGALACAALAGWAIWMAFSPLSVSVAIFLAIMAGYGIGTLFSE